MDETANTVERIAETDACIEVYDAVQPEKPRVQSPWLAMSRFWRQGQVAKLDVPAIPETV